MKNAEADSPPTITPGNPPHLLVLQDVKALSVIAQNR
jgi:hypothetical protein